MKKAIVLLSGGLDSTTTLYFAKSKGYECHALIFDYGQRHRREIRSAEAVAKCASVEKCVLRLKFPWKGSSLLDRTQKIPSRKKMKGIPSTYVPGRNIIFLSLALSYAEAIGASTIYIGANAIDYSGYPDCRPEFIKAFQQVARVGVRAQGIGIRAPLIKLSKTEIIKLALKLKAPIELTWSCYNGGKRPCGVCDSCRLRAKGFETLELSDPSCL